MREAFYPSEKAFLECAPVYLRLIRLGDSAASSVSAVFFPLACHTAFIFVFEAGKNRQGNTRQPKRRDPRNRHNICI